MLDRFSKGLRDIINKVTGYAFVDKKEIDSIVRDIQRVLLSSDVNVRIVLEFSEELRKELLREPPKGMTKKEWAVKRIYDRITELLGKEEADVPLKRKKIMLMGLYGSGKTTTAAKLAYFYSKRGLKPFLLGADVHRPAAMEQLKQLAERHGFLFFGKEGKAEEVVKEGMEEFERSGADVLIVDTAGRSGLDEELIAELKGIAGVLKPDERVLVIPADIGQTAYQQARAFSEAVGIDGIIITKMDATGKAGGAISAAYASGGRVWFIGTGEKIEEFEKYNPKRFVSRLLGFGDLEGLLEKAREKIDMDSAKKIAEGRFTLDDFIEQVRSVSSMGPIDKILDMMGLGRMNLPMDEIRKQAEKLKKWTYIRDSMTREERERPEIMNPSRIRRVAKGSGTSEAEVREMLKSFEKAKKLVKKIKRGRGFRIPGLGNLKLG